MPAKLPDAEILGALPSANSSRTISSIDGTAIGAAQIQAARGLAQAGQGIAQGLGDLATAFKVDDDLADAQTRADFLTAKVDLETQMRQEVDPEKLSAFPQKLGQLRQQFAQRYSDPRRAQRFMIETQDDLARTTANVSDRQFGIKRDAEFGANVERLQKIKDSALKATDEGEKRRLIDEGTAIYDGMARNGLIKPAAAVEAKRKWAMDYTIDDFRAKSPEERLVALRGNDGALKVRESGGNPRAENDLGYLGYYQFGAPRVADLGVYTPGANEQLQGWSSTAKNAPGKWSGTFNIPGFPNVKTKADFLANPDAQEKVYEIHQAKITQEMKANGFDKYIGQTVGGVLITDEGIRNMMHLGGAGSTDLFFRSGGTIDRADKNGTKLSDYARMGGTSSKSRMADFLDPDTARRLERESIAELMQKSHVAEQERIADLRQAEAERKLRVNDLQLGIMEDRFGPAEFMRAVDGGDLADADEREKIRKLLVEQGDRIERRNTFEGIASGAIPYNPLNSEHMKMAEEAVEFRMRTKGVPREEAALEVYEQTGAMTRSAVTGLRGLIAQNTPDSIMKAGEIASNIISPLVPNRRYPNGNPRAFEGVDGGSEVAEVAGLYSYFKGIRDTPYDAAKAVAELRSKDYKPNVKLNDKEEADFKKTIKDTAVKDFQNAELFGSGYVRDNPLPPEPMRSQMLEEYSSEVLSYYKKYGDQSLARHLATGQMKNVYGVSNGVIQKFPVEKAFPDMVIDGKHDWAYAAAAAEVKRITGKDADPKSVYFLEIPNATSNGFRSKSPMTPYQIVYQKDIGGQKVWDQLPGRFLPAEAFPAAYNKAQTAKTEAAKADRQQKKAEEEARQNPMATVNPRSWKPGRPMKTQDEIAAEQIAAQRAIDEAKGNAKKLGARSQIGGTGTVEERNQRIREGVAEKQAKEVRPTLPGISDWLSSTPSKDELVKRMRQNNKRNTLPGGDN